MKEDEIGLASSRHGRDEKCYNILVGRPEGKSPLGRPRSEWEENVRTYLREVRGPFERFVD
jgi:hypothetical protein